MIRDCVQTACRLARPLFWDCQARLGHRSVRLAPCRQQSTDRTIHPISLTVSAVCRSPAPPPPVWAVWPAFQVPVSLNSLSCPEQSGQSTDHAWL